MTDEILLGFVSALFGGFSVAVTNQILLIPKTRAESRKLSAEAAKLEVETSIMAKSQTLDEAVKARDPDMPEGWFAFGDAPYDYEIGIDSQIKYMARASGYVKSRRDPRGFGSLT